MANHKKYTLEVIKSFLEQFNASLVDENCTSITHDNCYVRLSDGYIVRITNQNIQKNTIPHKKFTQSPYILHNINVYMKENNIKATLLSDSYIKYTSNLNWKCTCGEDFQKSLAKCISSGFYCTECLRKNAHQLDYEKVKQEFSDRNYELLSNPGFKRTDYIEYICKEHIDYGVQKIKYIYFSNSNQGCKLCGRKKQGKSRQIPEDEIKQLTESKGFIYQSKITDKQTKIRYICKKHRDKGIQEMGLANMRRSKGNCPYCIGRYKNTSVFKNEISTKFPHITVLDEYQDAHTKMQFYCSEDSYLWVSTPNAILKQKYGCPRCANRITAKNKTKTHEKFIKELETQNVNVEILSQYTGTDLPIECKCKIHQYVWTTTPKTLLRHPYSCLECVKERLHKQYAKTHNQFIQELNKVNPDIVVLDKYHNCKTKIKCHCKIHDFIWDASPTKLLYRKTGCPKCSTTSGEQKLCQILDNMGYTYELQKKYPDCKHVLPLRFDCYIPSLNLLLEYDGETHYQIIPYSSNMEINIKRFEQQQRNDQIKNEYCQKHNIPLIRIPYWEKNNMEEFLNCKFKELNIS